MTQPKTNHNKPPIQSSNTNVNTNSQPNSIRYSFSSGIDNSNKYLKTAVIKQTVNKQQSIIQSVIQKQQLQQQQQQQFINDQK